MATKSNDKEDEWGDFVKGLGTRLGYAEKDITSVQHQLVGVAHSINLIKPEVNGIVTEFVAGNIGLKLFNFEKTLFDVGEFMDKRKGFDGETLKGRIDSIIGEDGRGGIIKTHDDRITKAQKTADEAEAKARQAKDKAERADELARSDNTHINRTVSAVRREGHSRATPQQSIEQLRDAAMAINRLEHRVNRLVEALS